MSDERKLTPVEEILRDMQREEQRRQKRIEKERRIRRNKAFWPTPNLVPRAPQRFWSKTKEEM